MGIKQLKLAQSSYKPISAWVVAPKEKSDTNSKGDTNNLETR